MTTKSLIQALNRLANAHERSKEKRYQLIGELLTLQVQADGVPHTPESFESVLTWFDSEDNDLLECMIMAYRKRLTQHEASKAPVLESKPC